MSATRSPRRARSRRAACPSSSTTWRLRARSPRRSSGRAARAADRRCRRHRGPGQPAARRARCGPVRLDPPRFHQGTAAREAWQHEGEPRRYNDRVSGFSLFVSRENPQLAASLACASAIGRGLRANGFIPSRYHADPVLGASREFADELNGVHYFDHLAVARHARMPALLFEAGVIVNRDEELRMRDPAVKQAIASALAQGIRQCLN